MIFCREIDTNSVSSVLLYSYLLIHWFYDMPMYECSVEEKFCKSIVNTNEF